MSRHTSRIEIDPETGEHVIELPEWLLREAGWDENTPLEWVIEDDRVFLREVRRKKAPRQI